MRLRIVVTSCLLLVCSVVLGADQMKPRVTVDFGAGAATPPLRVTFGVPTAADAQLKDRQDKPKTLEAAARAKLQAIERAAESAEGFDCKMVRHADPRYRSNMPVVQPPENVQFTMKVIPAPQCRAR
jgi:hypothetical protein